MATRRDKITKQIIGAGELGVGRTVDGVDVSVKAGELDTHVGNTSNPHSVTVVQLGAATDSDLTTHTSSTSNPHSVTALQLGVAELAFSTISVATQSDVVAESEDDTLTFTAGANMTITTDAATDTVTFASTGGGGGGGSTVSDIIEIGMFI